MGQGSATAVQAPSCQRAVKPHKTQNMSPPVLAAQADADAMLRASDVVGSRVSGGSTFQVARGFEGHIMLLFGLWGVQ